MRFGMTERTMISYCLTYCDCLITALCGGVSRAAKGADCKSAGLRLRRFESYLPHQSRDPERDLSASGLLPTDF